MGVYISGLKLPKRMPIKATIYPDGRVAVTLHSGEILERKAVPVSPHGRLGDLDKLADNMRSATAGMEHRAIIMHEIRRAPTIIAAEEGET